MFRCSELGARRGTCFRHRLQAHDSLWWSRSIHAVKPRGLARRLARDRPAQHSRTLLIVTLSNVARNMEAQDECTIHTGTCSRRIVGTSFWCEPTKSPITVVTKLRRSIALGKLVDEYRDSRSQRQEWKSVECSIVRKGRQGAGHGSAIDPLHTLTWGSDSAHALKPQSLVLRLA